MQGIKGFSKELATSYGSGVKLEPGKTYKEEECKVYRNGWHFVEYAPDCLNYFPLGAGNRYFLIEAAGDINEEQHFRCCCTEITLVKELDLKAFAGMSMKYMIQNPKMDWERAAAHLQIKQEIARAQKRRDCDCAGKKSESLFADRSSWWTDGRRCKRSDRSCQSLSGR